MNLLHYIPDAAEQCPAANEIPLSVFAINPRHKHGYRGYEQLYADSVDRPRMFARMPTGVSERHNNPKLSQKLCKYARHNAMPSVAKKFFSPQFQSQLILIQQCVVHGLQSDLRKFFDSSTDVMERDTHRNYIQDDRIGKAPQGLEMRFQVFTYLLHALQKVAESVQNRPSHNYVPFLGIALTEMCWRRP